MAGQRTRAEIGAKNRLYYGDNLDILRNRVDDGTVDLCYIDPPFQLFRCIQQRTQMSRMASTNHPMRQTDEVGSR